MRHAVSATHAAQHSLAVFSSNEGATSSDLYVVSASSVEFVPPPQLMVGTGVGGTGVGGGDPPQGGEPRRLEHI